MNGAISLYLLVVNNIWAFMVSNAIFNIAMCLIVINISMYFFKKLKNML